MRKFTFIFTLFLLSIFVGAQTGDSLAMAVECTDGNPVSATHVPNSTATDIPGLNCIPGGEDAFYFNTISPGTTQDNKITISMETDFGVVTSIDYQILRAPGNDVSNMVEVVCDSYAVTLGVSPVTPPEGFTNVITSNVNSGDVFYLRVYKPTDISGTTLSSLFAATDITMTSEYDATLSVTEHKRDESTIIVNQDEIQILNNLNFKDYKVYSITGKLLSNFNKNQYIENINISSLNTGLFILVLENSTTSKVVKFFKK